MRVLVTGGAGYIGSTLVPHLLSTTDFQVRVVDTLRFGGRSLLPVFSHPRLEFLRADVRDRETLLRALEGVHLVVHLAALVGEPLCARFPEEARQVNFHATHQLANICSQMAPTPRAFVFVNTCSVYGAAEDGNSALSEDSPVNATTVYAETKVAAERDLLQLRADGRLNAISLRLATVFGLSPRTRLDLLVHEMAVEAHRRGTIRVYNADAWRPFVHVEDVARAVVAVLDAALQGRSLAGVLNIGSNELNHRKREVAAMVQEEFPDAEIEYSASSADRRNYRVSFARALETLGFSTTKAVRLGVHEVSHALRAGILDGSDSWTNN